MTRSLQGPGRDNDPNDLVRMAHRIRDIKRDVNDLTSNVLRMAGLRAEPDLLRMLGELVVEGDLTVSGTQTVSGSLEVTGDTVIGGTLSLPAGIIDNDALASPVVPVMFSAIASGAVLAAAPAWTTVVSATVDVLDGFTKAVVVAITAAQISGGPVGTSSRVVVGGTGGQAFGQSNDFWVWSSSTRLVTGLTPGSSFNVLGQAGAAGSGTYTAATASIEGVAIWLR